MLRDVNRPLHCCPPKLLPRRSAHLPFYAAQQPALQPCELDMDPQEHWRCRFGAPPAVQEPRALCQRLLLHAALENPRARQSGEQSVHTCAH